METEESTATRTFNALVEIPAVVVIFLMMLHVTANALSRTFFDHPLKDTLEIVQFFYLPVIALLGFVAAQARGQHIATDLIYARLPRGVQPVVLFVVFAFSAVISAGFAWFGLDEARNAQEINRHAGISDIPSWPVFYLVPLVFSVLAVQLLVKALTGLAGRDLDLETTEPEEALVLDELDDLTRESDERATRTDDEKATR